MLGSSPNLQIQQFSSIFPSTHFLFSRLAFTPFLFLFIIFKHVNLYVNRNITNQLISQTDSFKFLHGVHLLED